MKQAHNDENPDLYGSVDDTFCPPEQDPSAEDKAYDALRSQQLINDTKAICRILRKGPLILRRWSANWLITLTAFGALANLKHTARILASS